MCKGQAVAERVVCGPLGQPGLDLGGFVFVAAIRHVPGHGAGQRRAAF